MNPIKNHPYLFCALPGALIAIGAFISIAAAADYALYRVIALFLGLAEMLLGPFLLLLIRSLTQKKRKNSSRKNFPTIRNNILQM